MKISHQNTRKLNIKHEKIIFNLNLIIFKDCDTYHMLAHIKLIALDTDQFTNPVTVTIKS